MDCGKTNRTYSQGGKTENFYYEVANHSRYRVATEKQEHFTFINYIKVLRETALEGRSNIYVELTFTAVNYLDRCHK